MEDTEEDILDGVLSDEETEPSSADSEPLTEEAAAIKIQSISRMHEEREAFLDKQHAATDIQKLARGNRSRRNSRLRLPLIPRIVRAIRSRFQINYLEERL